jgi:WD40 repeat protein
MDGDVAIKHILMFLKDTGLNESFAKLIEESGVSYNWVKQPEKLSKAIIDDDYGVVFAELDHTSVPLDILMDVYECACFHLVSGYEYDAALHLLLNSLSAPELKKEYETRYYALLQSIKSRTPLQLLGNSSYLDRKTDISNRIIKYLEKAPPSIFTSNHTLIIPADKEKMAQSDYVQDLGNYITLKEESKAECMDINGDLVAIGTADGFINILNSVTLQVPKELSYQEQNPMVNSKRVISVIFSNDGKLLASGDVEGNIKVWKVNDGACIRKIDKAHINAVEAIQFIKNNNMLLTASHDCTIKLYGLKSCQIMKEFKAHESYIHGLRLLSDEIFLSYSSDGSVLKWNISEQSPIQSCFPSGSKVNCSSVLYIDMNPTGAHEMLVIDRSNKMRIFTNDLKLTDEYSLLNISNNCFVCGCYSFDAKYIYGGNEDGSIYIFDRLKRTLKSKIKVSKNKLACIRRYLKELIFVDMNGTVGKAI